MLIDVLAAGGLVLSAVSSTEIELDRQFQIERETPASETPTDRLPGSCRDLAIANAEADGTPHPTGWTRIVLDGEAVVVWCDMDTAYGGLVGGWTLVWSNLRGGSGKLVTDMPWHKAIDSLPQYKIRSCGRPRTLEDFEVYTGLDQIIALGSDIAPGDESRSRGEMRYVWVPDFKADDATTHDAVCDFTIDPADAYKIDFAGTAGSGCHLNAGRELPGLFVGHDGQKFSTSDKDNDTNERQCSLFYSGTPFWYSDCWSGSIWGRGELSQDEGYNGAHWVGSPLELVREVSQRTKRLSMILIMASLMKASADLARCSRSRAIRRLRLIQESVRSTIHRFGRTAKPFVPGSRRTICSVHLPAFATAVAAAGP